MDPNYTDALYNKGLVFDSLGNYNEAIKNYDKVLEIDPNYTDALKNKNDALNKLII